MNVLIEQADRATVEAIRSAVPALIAVYRFGSSVTGERAPGSDVDLAVLAAVPLDPVRRFELQEHLASALGQSVDLVEDLTYGVYARLNEERRGILERVAAEGTVYGR
jgi:predicted nucleotidyltransferase